MAETMSENADGLFPSAAAMTTTQFSHPTGLLPSQVLKELIRSGEIKAPDPISDSQIQPASIDLRLGPAAYRVRASFLPGKETSVRHKIDQNRMHKIDLTNGAVLERGCVYMVPLMEHLVLSSGISGLANPKSSIGRLDVFTRLITDRAAEFDRVSVGYTGPLYAEISPRTFSIMVRPGSRLNQLRLRRRATAIGATQLKRLHDKERLVDRDLSAKDVENGIPVTVDLSGSGEDKLVGFRAKKHTDVIDVDKAYHYEPFDFWEPVFAEKDHTLILDPDDFYILASKESVKVPPDHAAEMTAYNTVMGEFRVHYAGFFDPGFGYATQGGEGAKAVLEVRSHDVPFMIEDGQPVGRLVYERLTDVPGKLYGAAIGSSYQRQGLQLSKQFKPYR